MVTSLYSVRGTELEKREFPAAKDSGGFGGRISCSLLGKDAGSN